MHFFENKCPDWFPKLPLVQQNEIISIIQKHTKNKETYRLDCALAEKFGQKLEDIQIFLEWYFRVPFGSLRKPASPLASSVLHSPSNTSTQFHDLIDSVIFFTYMYLSYNNILLLIEK